nr:helix-turn-helix transcriptional regulator [Paraliobacillus salinarum]
MRTFTKETGVTPYQYVMNTRIAAARFLLKASDASIKDIAFSTGFQSESSFCTCFKKIEQLTPSQYRKQID